MRKIIVAIVMLLAVQASALDIQLNDEKGDETTLLLRLIKAIQQKTEPIALSALVADCLIPSKDQLATRRYQLRGWEVGEVIRETDTRSGYGTYFDNGEVAYWQFSRLAEFEKTVPSRRCTLTMEPTRPGWDELELDFRVNCLNKANTYMVAHFKVGELFCSK